MKLARLAASLTAAVLLVSCADDPEPKVEPSESVSGEPTTSTSPTSEAPDPLGPEETVHAWVEARNEALLSGDMSRVKALSDKGCETCRELFEGVEAAYQAGGYVETEGWRIVSSRVESESARRSEVRAGVRFAGGIRVPSRGTDPIEFAPENHLMIFRLTTRGDGWLISLVGFIS